MRHIGCYLRVADRRGEAGLGKLRRIVAVDQIVDDAGVIGLLGPDLVEDQRALRLLA
jgi:hypothetical protein